MKQITLLSSRKNASFPHSIPNTDSWIKYALVALFTIGAHMTIAQYRPELQRIPCGPILTVAYEGGNITHPGVSVGSSLCVTDGIGKWSLYMGVKAGFYYHRRYQTGIFLLPHIRVMYQHTNGWMGGAEINAGPQWHLIPKAYAITDAGTIDRIKGAGILHWVIAPGLRFGKDISLEKDIPMQWFINPQLQFRNPRIGRKEKYLLMGAGINYKF